MSVNNPGEKFKDCAVVFLAFFLSSCVLQSVRFTPDLPFGSFVKIDVKHVKAHCSGKLADPSCTVDSGIGSGAIIDVGGSLQVLTAGHICSAIKEMTEHAEGTPGDDLVSVMIHADDGNVHPAFVLSMHPTEDICLMGIHAAVHIQPALLAYYNPTRAGAVWSLMAPAGVSGPQLVPVTSGHFSGGDSRLSVFTVPSHPGSSGGPILDSNGRIVGLVSQIHKDFHHIVVSPSLHLIKEFVSTVSKSTAERK